MKNIRKTFFNVIWEIPYIRDNKYGFVLGGIFDISLYVIVPLLGKEVFLDFLPAIVILFIGQTFYALVGIAKYKLGINKPKKHIAVDILLNYVYAWRRAL